MEEPRNTNTKGRVASTIMTIFWSFFLVLIVIKGDWSLEYSLMALLLVLILVLTGVRVYQEWVEDGEWLD